jgi:glycerol transport system substrate-binding protein
MWTTFMGKIHHRAGRQTLPAAGSAVRQPLLVPLRLVQTRPDFKKQFKEIYGYELGVPVNWSAYEDIAEFFTEHVREIDGKAVFGHNDYGKKAPDLGWRFTDAWLSMAGAGDKGIPNGKPVDEWGIRMEGCQPVGATVARGGAANGPAAKYALQKYMDWLRKYAPPGSLGMDFYTYLPFLANGSVAQQIFWYTAFLPSMVEPGPTVNADGTPNGAWPPRPMAPTGKKA